MFKLTESENQVLTLSEPVSIKGYETIPANTTIPKGHRLWATYEAWLAQGNTPEPVETAEERTSRLTKEVRNKRNQLLKETDYLVMPDYPNKSTAIKKYRKALRDITNQTGFPDNVEWPDNPMEGKQ